jgi:hypothetical protein
MAGPEAAVWTSADGSLIDLASATYCLAPDTYGLDSAPVELLTMPRLSAPGSARVGRRHPEREMFWVIQILSQPSTTTAVRDLARAFVQGGSLALTVDGSTRELREIEYRGGLEGVWNFAEPGVVGGPNRRMGATMVALDPWWYGAGDLVVLSSDAATGFDDAAVGFDDAAVLFDGASATPVLVSGDAAPSPVTTITGPYDTLTVGIAGGLAFQLSSALGAGDVITVDTRPGNRGPRLNGGAVDWSLLTAVSRLFELPLGGSVLLAQATGTTGDSQVSVAWDERWLTP